MNRMTEVPPEMVTQYNAIAGPLLAISSSCKELAPAAAGPAAGGKQTGLLMGRRLDAHALFRSDGKVFTKSTLPIQPPGMAVGMLDGVWLHGLLRPGHLCPGIRHHPLRLLPGAARPCHGLRPFHRGAAA